MDAPERRETLTGRLGALAERPAALRILFICAFVEASFFPLPPDMILVPLALARPRRAFAAATVCIAGSFAGALAGYMIGATVITGAGDRLISWAGAGSSFEKVLGFYRSNALAALCAAGFTAIPFSVFTIAAGFRHTVPPLEFVAGALLGRGIRFYLLAAALRYGGPYLRRMAGEHLTLVSVLFLLVAAILFFILKAV
ncbi:MAG TPA: DedA family protein [Bacteroidota bacterium]|nr:DedA family protein [Bacteroidota bacterium]